MVTPAPPRRDIALKLGIITRQMRKAFDRQVEEYGVTRSQWMVIAVVAQRPGTTQRLIAEALDMSEASAGRLIDRLCADGMLERRAKQDDRRAHCVFLTDAAKPILAKLKAIGEQSEAMALAGFSDEEMAQLETLLNRVYANVTPRREGNITL